MKDLLLPFGIVQNGPPSYFDSVSFKSIKPVILGLDAFLIAQTLDDSGFKLAERTKIAIFQKTNITTF